MNAKDQAALKQNEAFIPKPIVQIVQKELIFLHGLDKFGKWVGIHATILKKHPMKAMTYKRF